MVEPTLSGEPFPGEMAKHHAAGRIDRLHQRGRCITKVVTLESPLTDITAASNSA